MTVFEQGGYGLRAGVARRLAGGAPIGVLPCRERWGIGLGAGTLVAGSASGTGASGLIPVLADGVYRHV